MEKSQVVGWNYIWGANWIKKSKWFLIIPKSDITEAGRMISSYSDRMGGGSFEGKGAVRVEVLG